MALYEVSGSQPYRGNQPGAEFEADLSEAEEQRAVARGSIKRARRPARRSISRPAPKPTPKSTPVSAPPSTSAPGSGLLNPTPASSADETKENSDA